MDNALQYFARPTDLQVEQYQKHILKVAEAARIKARFAGLWASKTGCTCCTWRLAKT